MGASVSSLANAAEGLGKTPSSSTCQHCDGKFDTPRDLRYDQLRDCKLLPEKKTHNCSVCSQHFNSNQGLQQHLRKKCGNVKSLASEPIAHIYSSDFQPHIKDGLSQPHSSKDGFGSKVHQKISLPKDLSFSKKCKIKMPQSNFKDWKNVEKSIMLELDRRYPEILRKNMDLDELVEDYNRLRL